jgi:hypothetical protein
MTSPYLASISFRRCRCHKDASEKTGADGFAILSTGEDAAVDENKCVGVGWKERVGIVVHNAGDTRACAGLKHQGVKQRPIQTMALPDEVGRLLQGIMVR